MIWSPMASLSRRCFPKSMGNCARSSLLPPPRMRTRCKMRCCSTRGRLRRVRRCSDFCCTLPRSSCLATWSISSFGCVINAAELLRTNEELNRKIAERNRLQEANRQQELQLIQANKMTALGILASGVAHEINNPNQLVLTNSTVLTKVWEDAVKILDRFQRGNGEFTLARLSYAEMRETVAALIRDVNASALRIGRIVDDLKNFARPGARGVSGRFSAERCRAAGDALARASHQPTYCQAPHESRAEPAAHAGEYSASRANRDQRAGQCTGGAA